jgi:hypothetical protein
LLGVLLATIALTISVLEKSNRGLRGLNELGRNLRFIRSIRVISGSTILQIFVIEHETVWDEHRTEYQLASLWRC